MVKPEAKQFATKNPQIFPSYGILKDAKFPMDGNVRQRKASTFRPSVWKSRHLVLNQKYLTVYKSKNGGVSQVIMLEPDMQVDETDVAPNAFKITRPKSQSKSSGGAYYFEATSKNECADWMENIQECIEFVRSQRGFSQFDHIFGQDFAHPLNPRAIVETLKVMAAAEDRHGNGCSKQYRSVVSGQRLIGGLLKSKIAKTASEALTIFEWLVRTRCISPADMQSIDDPQIVLESDSMYYRYSRLPLPYTTILVTVLAARSLLSKDLNGLSDPYATVTLGGQKSTTRVIKRTLSPAWQETFLFVIHEDMKNKAEPLRISVFDHDTFGSDELLGHVVIENPRVVLTKESTWHPLTKFDGMSGEICLQLRVMPDAVKCVDACVLKSKDALLTTRRRSSIWEAVRKSTVLDRSEMYRIESAIERDSIADPIDRYDALSSFSSASCRPAVSAPPETGSSSSSSTAVVTILIRIHRAYGLKRSDLIGHCDPYAKILYNGTEKNTATIRSTSEPVWDEVMVLNQVPADRLASQRVRIELHDSDFFLLDDFLGATELTLDQLLHAKQRFSLFRKTGRSGEIYVTARMIDAYGITMETCEHMCLDIESHPAILPALFYRLASSQDKRISVLYWHEYLKQLNAQRHQELSWRLNLYEMMKIHHNETILACLKECSLLPKRRDHHPPLLQSFRHHTAWIALTEQALYIQRFKFATEIVLRIDLSKPHSSVRVQGACDLVINDVTVLRLSSSSTSSGGGDRRLQTMWHLIIAEVIACHRFGPKGRATQLAIQCIQRFHALSALQTREEEESDGLRSSSTRQEHRTAGAAAGTEELKAQLPFTFFHQAETEAHREAQMRLQAYLTDPTPSSKTQLRFAAEALWNEHVIEIRSAAVMNSAKDIGDNLTLCLCMIRQIEPTLRRIKQHVRTVLAWERKLLSFTIWLGLMVVCLSRLLCYSAAIVILASVGGLLHLRLHPPAPIPRPSRVKSASLLRKFETARQKKRQAKELTRRLNVVRLKLRALITSERRSSTNYLLLALTLLGLAVACIPIRYFVAAGVTKLFFAKRNDAASSSSSNRAAPSSRLRRFLIQQWEDLPPRGQ